ncbi:hypothetical protein AALP_AA3G073800 [Arabis alpina]|uniref:E3 ubiquitin-protein ligase MARCHF6-like C-terminal domain-containing protein n=1 Tax=Arabis alpina TaxID=50452 RepID=A0A087H7N1_ARAAL|nr:hypothetical protein AALP_AA3G073800 [Arabis alpina]
MYQSLAESQRIQAMREELIAKIFPGGFHAEILIENFLGHGVASRVARLLWKYKRIMCDWCHSHLHNFLGEPPRLVGVALHEFGAIGRLLFFLDYNAFAGLTISIYMSFLFVLLPFFTGLIVLATVEGSYLSNNSPIILGYMILLSISFAYFGIFFTLRQISFPAIVRWFSLGYHFITVKLPCLVWVFLIATWKNMFVVVKGTFVLGLKIGVLPWIIGCWLDLCTFSMSGTTVSRRIEILSDYPALMGIYWMIGYFCVVNAYNFMYLIQEIIRKRAFCFLLDIRDPDYKITNLNLGQTLFAFASHGILLVILLHLPIKTITLISPSFFPLQFWAYDQRFMLVAISGYMLIMNASIAWLDSVIRPAITPSVHNWIITVSSWLQQMDDDPWLYAIAEGSVVSLYGSQNAENDIDDHRDNRLMLRLAMLLILAALTLFLVSTTFMALPILLGRAFFYSFSFIIRFRLKHDDFYAFWIGSCILRVIYISTCFVFDHIWTGRTDLLLKYVLIWTRNGLFFSIWISVIPGLLGLLIDLMIIIPYRVPLNESPVYFLIQDWLIGVVVLHIWTFLAMLTPVNCFATKACRTKLERIRDVGINSLPSMWLLRDVIGSIINTLLTTLSIPYMLVKSLFPLLGFSQSDNAAIERFIWPVLLALIAIWFITKKTYDLTVYLHQLVFDDRYVVGKRVGDLTEDL